MRRAGVARTVRYLAGFGVGQKYGVHTDTLLNLARGIVERVFYTVCDGRLTRALKPKPNAFKKLNNLKKRLIDRLYPTPVVSRDEYPDLYIGRKRAIYRRAVDSLGDRPINIRDSWVNTFVKAEKINFSDKVDPAPRVIQPRATRYGVEVGRYLKLFEAELSRGFERLFGYKVILKGLNASGVGEALCTHWKSFEQPVAVGLDASRFDQHVSVEALKWEHSVYNAVFKSDELRKLLKWQLHNHGIARVEGYRVDYDVDGCRMSGDLNTGMGNCLLMSCMVIGYCESVGVKFRLANNGDDCVLFVEKQDLHMLDGISEWFYDLGFRLTREEPVFVLEEVVFCQSQPVLTGNGYRMVRDPRKAMSKDCVSILGWSNELEFYTWANAIGVCGATLTAGVPVWSAWYNRLIRLGVEAPLGVVERVYDSGMGYMSRGVEACPITAECRVSFYRAFGILPDLQEAAEHDYSQPVEITAATPMIFNDIEALDIENPLTKWLRINK